MSPAMVKRVNFLEHTGPGVSGYFVDNFNSKLLICPDISACPDRRISPLSKDFSGHMVQILKGRSYNWGICLFLFASSAFSLFFTLLEGLCRVLTCFSDRVITWILICRCLRQLFKPISWWLSCKIKYRDNKNEEEKFKDSRANTDVIQQLKHRDDLVPVRIFW